MESIPRIRQRRVAAENRFFRLIEDDLPDRHGRDYTYYHLDSHWDAVLVLPMTRDGQLIIERIYRHPYAQWMHEFPAGGIEPGEDPLAAAQRELGEETGYQAQELVSLHAFGAMPGLARHDLHLVLARGCALSDVRPALEAMEMLSVELITPEAAWALTRATPASSFLTTGLLALAAHGLIPPPSGQSIGSPLRGASRSA